MHVAQNIHPLLSKVVGMMWQTMVQFQTWFGASEFFILYLYCIKLLNLMYKLFNIFAAPFLVYGIQLMPLTSISEQNFDLEWLYELYPSFANSCKAHALCEEQGWVSVLILSIYYNLFYTCILYIVHFTVCGASNHWPSRKGFQPSIKTSK